MTRSGVAMAVCAFCIRLLAPATACAQLAASAEDRADLLRRNPASADPTTSSPLSFPEWQVVLEASREAKEITARFGVQKGDWGLDVKLKGPIGESSPQAPLADLTGLAADVSADIGLTRTAWKVTPIAPALSELLCERNNRSLSVAEMEAQGGSLFNESAAGESVVGWPDFIKALATPAGDPLGRFLSDAGPALVVQLAARTPPIPESDKIELLKAVNAALKTASATSVLRAHVTGPLPTTVEQLLTLPVLTPAERLYVNRQLLELALPRGPEGSLQMVRRAGPPCRASALSKAFRREYLDSFSVGSAFQFGLRFKAARTDFQYVTSDMLAAAPGPALGDAIEATDKTRYGFSGTLVLGVLSPNRNLIAAGVSYQSSYSPATDPVSVCRPITTTDALACRELALGEPTRASKAVGYVEYRRRISKGLGVAPQVFYDAKREHIGLNVPIYFLASGSGLSGGIALKWEEKAKFVASLFVGNVFNFEDAR
jgi:hypothetical protein